MAREPRRFFEELVAAMAVPDRSALEHLVHPDYEGAFPQSGELTRGFEQFMAGLENYPGGPPGTEGVSDVRLMDDEERWAITPGYTVVPLANVGMYTLVGKSRYPDGALWHIIMSVELRDERLYRTEVYFAPEMPAPLMAAIGRGHGG
jgi:hypothetical protein